MDDKTSAAWQVYAELMRRHSKAAIDGDEDKRAKLQTLLQGLECEFPGCCVQATVSVSQLNSMALRNNI